MKTGNFPRWVIEGGLLPFRVGDQDWLISITDKQHPDLRTPLSFEHILFVQFNDTHDVGQGEITETDAVLIAEFIKSARAHQKNLYANCHAGVCRSGAIVSLLIDLGDWEDARCRLSPERIPNLLVYHRVRQHFPELEQSWDAP